MKPAAQITSLVPKTCMPAEVDDSRLGMRVTVEGRGGYFPEGKRTTAGREAEEGDELMNNRHMVPGERKRAKWQQR